MDEVKRVTESEYERRREYQRVNETVRYAQASNANGDGIGERIALKHACELILNLLVDCYEITDEDGACDGLELDGMREMSREVQDIQESRAAQEEGPQEAHVVPVVQDGDAAPRKVLSGAGKHQVNSKKHGTTGNNPKGGASRRVFRLFLVDSRGDDVKLVDTGTAAELANRNDGITPKQVYNWADRPGRAGRQWRVEKLED